MTDTATSPVVLAIDLSSYVTDISWPPPPDDARVLAHKKWAVDIVFRQFKERLPRKTKKALAKDPHRLRPGDRRRLARFVR